MKLIVNPHKIEINKSPVNEREIDITKCEFEFAEEITSDYVKEAYFTFDGTSYKKIIVNNQCTIPSEVLAKKGQVEIGVVAFLVENEEEIKRYNPSPAYFNTWLGSLKDNAENSEPITPSEMEQYEQALNDGLTEVNDKLDEIDQALDDVTTAIIETNNLDLDVSKEGKTATVTLTKKDATTKTVTLSDGTSLMFNWDGTRLGIKTDEDENYQYVDLQGVQGPIGPQGEAFQIKKTYSSVAEMNADFNNMQLGDYVMIASTVEVEDNAKLYTRGEEQWIFISDFSGAQGIRGETGLTPNIQIGTVTSGATPSVTRTGTNENPILNFVLEKGEQGIQGIQGETGNGIASITKTGTLDTVDTYTILYTDGTTSTFTVTNGEVSQAQLNTVQSQVDKYKTLSLLLPKVEGEGTSVELSNTVGGVTMDITPEGATSQESTTGANLQKYTPRSYPSYHYNCDEKGQATISGNNSGNISNLAYNLLASDSMTLEAGTYVLKLVGTKSSLTTVKVLGSEITLDTNNEYTFTLNETTTDFYVSFLVVAGLHDDNFYITLAKDTATTERYTGGIPSPNSDYPQPIKVVTGEQNIKVQNKNYLDVPEVFSVTGRVRKTITLPAGTYHITCGEVTKGGNNSPSLVWKGAGISLINNRDTTRTLTKEEALTLDIYSNGYDYSASQGVTSIINNLMISREGGEYEHYHETNYPLSLGDLKLYETQQNDYIYGSPKGWYIKRNNKKIIFDGTETWLRLALTSNIGTQFYMAISNLVNDTDNKIYKSNYFQSGILSERRTNYNTVYPYQSGICFNPSVDLIGTNVSNWTSWLTEKYQSGNPLFAICPLVTGTDEQITDTTLINQLNNLYNALAYQDTTIITCSSASDDNETLVVKASTYKDISSILNPTETSQEL